MKPKVKRQPTTDVLLDRISRKQSEHHQALVKQLTSISLDVAATVVLITKLHEQRIKQDAQTDRLIGLVRQLVEQDKRRTESLRQLADTNRFMSQPPRAGRFPWPHADTPARFTEETYYASPEASTAGIPTLGLVK